MHIIKGDRIGPYFTGGFYYDFQVEEPFRPEDLKAIEKKAQRIVKEGQAFHRVVVDEDEAIRREASEPFKLELIEDKGKGEVVWQDLCRGPRLPRRTGIGNTHSGLGRGFCSQPFCNRLVTSAATNV